MPEGDAAERPDLKVVNETDTSVAETDAPVTPKESQPENSAEVQVPPDENLTEDPAAKPAQSEMPFAVVQGEAFTELPRDLYIPPDALEVFLEAFEGPLDLLLYLIRRQNLDILNIPITEITRQYVEYIDLMDELQLDLVGEYLLMAAMLAEIKSRMLLPRAEADAEDEDDPRAELVRRLLEYERYKKAADEITILPRMERDIFQASAEPMQRTVIEKLPDLHLKELMIAFKDVLARADMLAHHHIQAEPLSVRQRMSEVLEKLKTSEFTEFKDLFDPAEGRRGVTVTFLSLLELLKESLIELAQSESYSQIHVRASSSVQAVPDLPVNSEFDETEPDSSEIS